MNEGLNENIKNPEHTQRSEKQITENIKNMIQGSLDFNQNIEVEYEGANTEEAKEMKEAKESASDKIHQLNNHASVFWKENFGSENSQEDPLIEFSKNKLKNSDRAA